MTGKHILPHKDTAIRLPAGKDPVEVVRRKSNAARCWKPRTAPVMHKQGRPLSRHGVRPVLVRNQANIIKRGRHAKLFMAVRIAQSVDRVIVIRVIRII